MQIKVLFLTRVHGLLYVYWIFRERINVGMAWWAMIWYGVVYYSGQLYGVVPDFQQLSVHNHNHISLWPLWPHFQKNRHQKLPTYLLFWKSDPLLCGWNGKLGPFHYNIIFGITQRCSQMANLSYHRYLQKRIANCHARQRFQRHLHQTGLLLHFMFYFFLKRTITQM